MAPITMDISTADYSCTEQEAITVLRRKKDTTWSITMDNLSRRQQFSRYIPVADTRVADTPAAPLHRHQARLPVAAATARVFASTATARAGLPQANHRAAFVIAADVAYRAVAVDGSVCKFSKEPVIEKPEGQILPAF